jgi:hypothetical protein
MSAMLGDGFGPADGTLRRLMPVSIHGQTFWDVEVEFEGGRVEGMRLGPEGVPKGLNVGDRVSATRVGMVIIAIRKI